MCRIALVRQGPLEILEVKLPGAHWGWLPSRMYITIKEFEDQFMFEIKGAARRAAPPKGGAATI